MQSKYFSSKKQEAGFYPLMDQCEDYAANGGSGNENENSQINQSSKTPGLKIISKQVMRAVQQGGFTTYKEVANVVSQVSSCLLTTLVERKQSKSAGLDRR
jgi:hypothetical protein